MNNQHKRVQPLPRLTRFPMILYRQNHGTTKITGVSNVPEKLGTALASFPKIFHRTDQVWIGAPANSLGFPISCFPTANKIFARTKTAVIRLAKGGPNSRATASRSSAYPERLFFVCGTMKDGVLFFNPSQMKGVFPCRKQIVNSLTSKQSNSPFPCFKSWSTTA